MTGTIGIIALGAILMYKVVPKIIKAVDNEGYAPVVYRHVPVEIVLDDGLERSMNR